MSTILIVDDRPINREFLTSLLGSQGHSLREAGDGAEALAAARAEPPDLVISDLLMPTMDGFELLRQLRSDPALAATPVIFYTAKYHVGESRELESHGNVKHLDKPSEPETILSAVEQALAAPAIYSPLQKNFERTHLRVVTDKLARTIEQLETSQQQMLVLSDLVRLVTHERDPSAVLDLSCHGARSLVTAKYAIVVVLAEDRQTIHRLRASGMDEAAVARINRPAVDLGPVCRLLDSGRPLRLRRGSNQSDVTGLLPDDAGRYSLLFVSGSRHAALILVEKLGADGFTEDDERLTVILAAQMAVRCEIT